MEYDAAVKCKWTFDPNSVIDLHKAASAEREQQDGPFGIATAVGDASVVRSRLGDRDRQGFGAVVAALRDGDGDEVGVSFLGVARLNEVSSPPPRMLTDDARVTDWLSEEGAGGSRVVVSDCGATTVFSTLVCFSLQADVAAGVVLVPVAALALREVRHLREVPFAALPLLFAAHQFVEAFVWAGLDGDVSPGTQRTAALIYLVFALSVLPTLVPLAVLLLEPRGARRRVAPFVGLGIAVSAYLAYALARGPVRVIAHAHAIEYNVHLDAGVLWSVLYVVAVIGPSVLSGYRSVVLFGVLNLVGLSAAAALYVSAFASVWCVFAAMTSLLVLIHMYRRRHLPDSERLKGLTAA